MFDQTLIQIPPATIEVGPIAFDIYTPHPYGHIETFATRGSSIGERKKAALEKDESKYFIHADDLDIYTDYAYGRLERIVNNERVTTKEKTKVLYLVGKRTVRKLLDNPLSGEAIKEAGTLVEHYVETILEEPEAASNMLALSSMDAYTFSHSINVATFNLLLGTKLFGGDRTTLWEIGISGILHDVGKTMVDQDILFKPARLTPMEMEIVRQHAEHSYEIIRKHGFKEEIQLAGRSHHERFEGGGYPDKISGYDIHQYARVTTVSDVYDALTSSRVYKKGCKHTEALIEMARTYGHFDLDIFNMLLDIVLRNRTLVEHFQQEHLHDALEAWRLGQGDHAKYQI